ncbi:MULTISPECIES: salt stress protein, Slr1339 family [unclassified Coleofasciculus]|uniref:salt stress protein, Slr1339 family n=1 Tax=unclassified Coleofasciculus TaxID=2692782 RepID=UPI001880D3B8|nr:MULTISPECIES: hypothetical protein [unclassified Coleofasciculus]MBE9129914.1 hypothetical protein [Coleofasciculus sp. LEGE 07081]MBE9152344.1 hypothetical protein [Coleofasciculus sp. LEGE 07092]
MESIDDLLAQVKAEYQEGQAQPPQKKPLFEEEDLNSPVPSPTYKPQPSSPTPLSAAEEGLLAELKAEFAEQEQAEEQNRQQQLREEQLRQEQQLREEQLRNQQREQKRREALTQRAIEWLKKLDSRSEEGLWFEEFSYSYPSKLEAAIDYLQALRETRQ